VSDPAGLTESDEPQSGDDFIYRLGIRHLILWGISTAVVMSARETIQLINFDLVLSPNRLVDLISDIACGAALAGLLIGYSRWRNGQRVVIHPGHLFLYLAGIALLLDLGLTLGLTLWAQGHGRSMVGFFYHRQLVGYGISAVILIFALVWNRHSPLWCLPIVALLLLSISQVVGSALILVHAGRPILQQYPMLLPIKTFLPLAALAASTILIVGIVDAIRSDERRDWMHWAGVTAFVAMAAPHLINALLRWL